MTLAASELMEALRRQIDNKTKPLGSLGRLEEIALKLGQIQRKTTPCVDRAQLYVIAADHGIAREGVSAYPQEVTAQMVQNFLDGGAAINALARTAALDLRIVDAGIATTVNHPDLLDRRVGNGTRSFLHEPAMTTAECEAALQMGRALSQNAFAEGSELLAFGEMGIGNTSSAAILTSLHTRMNLAHCVGKGAGLDDEGVTRKRTVLARAIERFGDPVDPFERMRTYGGFELAMMAGAMMEAADLRIPTLVDGYIVSAALAIAVEMKPETLEACIFAHRSAEPGHDYLLKSFSAKPLLELSLRLGEGTGAALAYPLVRAAAAFLNDMATFEQAGVSRKSDG